MEIVKGNKIIVKFLGQKSTAHSGLKFYDSWDALMPVIEEIQKVDLKELFYKFDRGGETQYNFEGFEFTLCTNGCYSGVNLMLDPQMEIAVSFDVNLTWLQNTWVVVVKTLEYINDKRNRYEHRD